MSNQPTSVRAVAYLRMSTDRQRLSIENQLAFIREYAANNNFEITRLYADEGQSGLHIEKRSALKNLIEEVKAGECDFAAILVYDISRWGRFQDSDESAFYEHICARAGIRVHYCAEPFENDNSLSATLMKAMKRAMAGEFSRELSVKVFAAHTRLAARGFRQGGFAGYGLRRQAVDENGVGQYVFEDGQRKALHTHRLKLIPGPADEVATVHRVYSLFLNRKYSAAKIAKILNEEHVTRRARSNRWNYQAIMEILGNEKYFGCNVYGKTSKKLGAREIKNNRSQWVTKPDAFKPIVAPELFEKAQAMRRLRCSYTEARLLEYLTILLRNFGFLSSRVIDAHADLGKPCSGTYLRRFGSLKNAFELIGYNQPERGEVLKCVSEMKLKGKAAGRAKQLRKMLQVQKQRKAERIRRTGQAGATAVGNG
jgi:DNA invertase Pin-like site-specific DNA recombinase